MAYRMNSNRLALAGLMLLSAATLTGQGSGTIQGTVTDPSGAVIPQALVTARNIATGVETARPTTASGLYVLSPLSPGVAAVVTQSAGPSYTSFNGARAETNELYLEGIAMTFPNQQGDTRDLALGVSVEAVEQFQVEVNGQKASFQGQGFHNYVLKSGANRFHGSGYEYFRNTAFDARGFF